MEAVGFAISIISLAGIFKDCIDLFFMISTARSMGQDFTILSVKLDIERTLLLQWAEQVRLIHEDYDRRLDDPDTKRVISRILQSIKFLLSDGASLEHRYGMQSLKIDQQEYSPILSSHRLQQFQNDFQKLTLNNQMSVGIANGLHRSPGSSRQEPEVNTDPGSAKQKATLKAKFCWAVRDKEKFSNLIQHLSELVRGLNAIVPLKQSTSLELLNEDLGHVDRISRLQLLVDGARDYNGQIPLKDVFQAQIEQRCQRRILDSLWFRMLDHRINSVSEAHPGTFNWALNPPTDDVEWDDLSEWLESGSGIYWIHGKPGSGKTTLMKNLYDNSMTHSLLREWAEDKPIVTPNFFFWQLGVPEQKTQYGLYKGLLYQIFTEDPSLIPYILPEMWREARNDNGFATQSSTEARTTSLDHPTEEELMLAFHRLKAHSQAAYCFFIDGLDEYSGDPFRLIEFLEKLVSSNIKAIVSSRPIPSCFQAFSRGPKLRLQDLTRHDIKTYVHDTIVLHPHTETLIEMNRTIVDKIESELTEKASGVFLWVVLACRSLIQGFAAFDSPEELQQRLNELPPELNDLFKHILQRFDPRYYEQAAKLLRLCYHSTDLRTDPANPHEALFTLGLALADADNLDITRPLQINYLSQEEKVSRCKLLEARLRSRCCGLLEIRLGNFRRRTCFCQSSDLHSRDHSEGQIVDSIVEFIHRTFFEFLKIPGIWDNEYLQIRDEGFSPDAVLSRVNAHLMLVSVHRLLDDENGYQDSAAFEYISESLRHLRYIDYNLREWDTGLRGQMLLGALLETAEILRLLNCMKEVEIPWLRRLCDYLKLHFGTSKNGCLDLVAKLVCELGMETTFQHMDISRYGGQSSPLLYHAIERPLVPNLLFEMKNSSSSHSIISELVANGCDVNEVFVEQFCGEETTPWIHWLAQSPSDEYDIALGDSWMAEQLLSGGADIACAEDWFKMPITILVGRRILGESLEESNVDEEDGGFNGSHPFFEEDLSNENELRLAYEQVRRLLRNSATQRREKVGVDSVPTTAPGHGCDEGNMLKRRRGESIQDDENAYSSASGRHQTKRQRISTPSGTGMETQELA